MSTNYANFRTAAVLGAGVMGSQIAAHLANAGLTVWLLDMPAPQGPKSGLVQQAFGKMLKMKPSPVVTDAVASRIFTGNFEENLDVLGKADWIIEVIIEQMDAKKSMMARIEQHARPDAVISSNTSGLPIQEIAADCSAGFRKRFLGTHFFNPPRYLKLLEIIPTPDTDPEITNRVSHFGRVHLGKGIVHAKDTPNFIANRVGTYSMMLTFGFLEKGYTIEEIDLLTGQLTGRPKSATFRTADVVGLDTLTYVSKNLYKAIPNDPDRDVFRVPDLLLKLVEQKALGAKTGRGFYFKDGKVIKSLNSKTLSYEAPAELNLGDLNAIQKQPLAKRWEALFGEEGRAGDFIREHTTRMIAYAMNRIPEISDFPRDVDLAIQWGFGWQMGPFAICDAIGPVRFSQEAGKLGLDLPLWFRKMLADGDYLFYKQKEKGLNLHYVPGTGYKPVEAQADEISLAAIKASGKDKEVWSNPEAALIDAGDGVLIYEFRSKANTLGFNVINGVFEALEFTEKGDWRGLVIANDGENFSVGANLGELAHAALSGQFDMIEKAVHNFQKAALAIRYAQKPVVNAIRGKVLGGGVELTMGAASVVAATETYMGLVELGVGLIPAGSGTMTMVARAGETAPTQHPSHIQPFLQKVFETIAMAKVATSGQQAVDFGYLTQEQTRIAMNDARRIYMAKEEVIRLSNQGYIAPPVRHRVFVPGKPGFAPLQNAAWQMQQAGWISEYDAYLATRLAHVMCGGELLGPEYVHEDYLIDLEREVFLSLLGQEKTRARIESILKTNKPLRN